MARAGSCNICSHPQRAEIERAMIAGESMTKLERRFRGSTPPVSRSVLYRHRKDHIPAALARAKEAEEVLRGDELLREVQGLYTRAKAIVDRAEKAKSLGVALKGLQEARNTLELLARLVGDLSQAKSHEDWLEEMTVNIAFVSHGPGNDPPTIHPPPATTLPTGSPAEALPEPKIEDSEKVKVTDRRCTQPKALPEPRREPATPQDAYEPVESRRGRPFSRRIPGTSPGDDQGCGGGFGFLF